MHVRFFFGKRALGLLQNQTYYARTVCHHGRTLERAAPGGGEVDHHALGASACDPFGAAASLCWTIGKDGEDIIRRRRGRMDGMELN